MRSSTLLGFSHFFALIVFVLSGCVTTAEQVREHLWASTIPSTRSTRREFAETADTAILVRHEVPLDDGADDRISLTPDLDSGTIMDSRQAAIFSEAVPSPSAETSTPSIVPSPDPLAPSVQWPNANPDGPTLGGLSSISRNRLANRVVAAPPFDSGGTTGLTMGRPGNSLMEGASPILRNRLRDSISGGDEPEFSYPDIHDDPAKRYHDLYGVDEEHDPFLFPSLMNVIFEDRWLLAEKDPGKALKNQLQRRMKIDIRDPDPDLANFPNGAYTIPKGRLYIENSPLGFYGASPSGSSPRIYQWEYLIRYGLTDNLEFRVFSNGLSDQAAQRQQPAVVGYQPLAFDFKANFWEENTKYHLPAMGVEIYLQTKLLGSSAFNTGTQPSINLLFDQSLPLGIGFEYNFGYTGVQNNQGQIAYQFSYQWSFQREVVKDFDVFFHGFYNAAALPRLNQFQSASTAAIPNVTVMGFGGIWTVSDQLAVFGSYNFGVTPDAPNTFALLGFALAL